MQPFINIDLGGPAQPLLKVNHLLKYFRGGKGREVVQAVDDISFTVMKGETLGWSASRAAANLPPPGC